MESIPATSENEYSENGTSRMTTEEVDISFATEGTNENYRLIHTNPVTTRSIDIHIEQFNEGNYAPYQENYVLSLWSERGMVRQLSDSQSNVTIDCTNLPAGLYQLVLQVGGAAVANNKVII